MFDELKILITGDTSGIAAAVKKAVNVVQGGVKEMNSQEVDWTGIFSRAVSPAIISSVASVFAFAISQSVGFSTAMAQTGTAAGDTTAQIAQLSKGALDLSTRVPVSAQDIANSMAQVSAIFGNVADQQEVVAAMSQLAASGFGDLSSITSTAIDIFKQFGVTTTDQAIKVLTTLMHGAEAAKETIPDLANQFASFSSQLPGAYKNVDSFNGLLSTFASEVQNVGAAGAQQIFAALASSASSAVGPMELLGVSFKHIQESLLTDGGLSAIQKTSAILDKMGPGAALIATNFGLSAQQVGQFQTNASKFPKIANDAQAIANNTQTINDAWRQADTGLNLWIQDWNKLKALVTSSGISEIFDDIAIAIGKVIDLLQASGGLLKPLSGSASGGNLLNLLGIGGVGVGDLLSLFTGGSSGNTNGLNAALQGTGVNGFNGGVLSRIDKTASQNGLVDSLISALQTGIKGGQYAQLVNTFNLTVPSGSQGLTAKQIAQQLYNQFQGTQ